MRAHTPCGGRKEAVIMRKHAVAAILALVVWVSVIFARTNFLTQLIDDGPRVTGIILAGGSMAVFGFYVARFVDSRHR